MADVDALTSHFWWRSGWRPDRSYLTWHVLPDARLVAALEPLRRALADAGAGFLSVVEPDRLHMTGPGVGFADEIPEPHVEAMVRAARGYLAALAPFEAAVGGPVVGRDGVLVPVEAERLATVRRTLRAAMRAVGLEPPGADDEPYRPHVTLAYATGPGSRARLVRELDGVDRPVAPAQIAAVHLLALRMLPAGYDWQVRAVVPLGAA